MKISNRRPKKTASAKQAKSSYRVQYKSCSISDSKIKKEKSIEA